MSPAARSVVDEEVLVLVGYFHHGLVEVEVWLARWLEALFYPSAAGLQAGRSTRDGVVGRQESRQHYADSPRSVPRSKELKTRTDRSGFTLPMIWVALPTVRCASWPGAVSPC